MPNAEVAETVGKTDAAEVSDSSSGEASKPLGDDFLKIPCMRSSLLNGYIGAVAGGLAGFFYTNTIRTGAHCALGSYWIVSIGCWFTCRYKLYKEKKLWENVVKNVEEHRVKKNEYNLPPGLQKLTEKTVESGDTSKT